MNVIHLPPRLSLVPPPAARPEPPVTIAHAEGRLRSAIGHVADASSHMLDAALCNGDREQNFDLAAVAIEEALLDLVTLTAHSDDIELRRLLRMRRAEREQG